MLTLFKCGGKVIGYHYATKGIVDFEMEEPLKWQQRTEQE